MKRYIIEYSSDPVLQKKVKENILLSQCLHELFIFFKNNDHCSAVDHLDIYNRIEKDILSSKVISYYYNPKLDQYIVTTDKVEFSESQRKVYVFVWSVDSQRHDSFIITANEEGSPCCLEFYFKSKKYLPFITSIGNDIDPSFVMSMHEFSDQLQGNLTVIAVG